jgi:hypothetical protein
MKKLILLTLTAILPFCTGVHAEFNQQRIGFSHTYPTEYQDWQNAFLSGNGKMGVMVFGNPLDETVIFNDRHFNLATGTERSFAQVGAGDLAKIKDLCAGGKFAEANKLATDTAQYKGGGEGSRHPGYGMFIHIPENGTVSDYTRICNFRTGEVIVKWTDRRGQWERKSFVSRKDNVIVQYLPAPANGKLSCDIQLDLRPEMGLPKSTSFTRDANHDFLNIRVKYKPELSVGYEGVTRVVVSGGGANAENGILHVKDADSVLLLTRIHKYYDNFPAQCDKKELQSELATIPANYETLLKDRLETHQVIYDRVKLDLNAGPTERAKTNAELIAEQAASNTLVPAFLERIFDAGRYYYLSSSSEIAPPDLLGIWTGDCRAGWGGFYHLDANLNLQIGGGNIGDMPEAMEGYFSINESWQKDFRVNATKLLGCRGMVAGGNTPGIGHGLMAGISDYYPYQYATGEEGWLLYPFWEHYLITGDQEFLRKRLYPLLKDMGEFYEDFLKKKDANGNYIFAGSISPEAQPPGLGVSLVNNSVFDISGARFCLGALLESGKILGIGDGVAKWRELYDHLPPYLINEEGYFQEWAWPGFKEGFGHRHSSHLLTVWPYREITPESNPVLFAAAAKAIARKTENRLGTGHGILHVALIGAGVKNESIVQAMLLRLTKWGFYFDSLCTSHNPKLEVFCTDIANTMPAILMEMLISSSPDNIELLPALPWELNKGAIGGVKGRNRTTVENLNWDLDAHQVRCTLRSDIDQSITLIERSGIRQIKTDAKVQASPLGEIARVVQLKAGVSVNITLETGTLRDSRKPRENLALNKPVTASSSDEGNKFFPANLCDGNPETRWASANKDNQWIYVDLGATKKISGVKLFWEKSAAMDYDIEVSDDAQKWSSVKSVTANDQDGIVIFGDLHDQGRYVRINCKTRITTYGFSLWELEVYEDQ